MHRPFNKFSRSTAGDIQAKAVVEDKGENGLKVERPDINEIYQAPVTPEQEEEAEKAFAEERERNAKTVFKVLFYIMIANLAVSAVKITAGLIINSSSLTADGFHSVSDGMSNIIGMIAMTFAGKPEDKCHPYGHGKVETMSGLLIGALLSFLGIKVIIEAIGKLKNPVMPAISLISLLSLLFTIFINYAVATYERKKGEELESEILISDSTHTKADIFISIGVLAGLAVMKSGLPAILDPLISLVLAGFILHAAWEVFQQNASVLIDSRAVSEDFVKAEVMKIESVIDVHKIRSRGKRNRPFIDMHVVVEPNMTVAESHALEHRIELHLRDVLDAHAGVMIHFEPAKDMAKKMKKVAKRLQNEDSATQSGAKIKSQEERRAAEAEISAENKAGKSCSNRGKEAEI